ncbi:hypothetical protein AVEN_174903-1 [Araneus ventricosus]|uniref:Uncharacterized protein n=1 Tax=Araneus ventricosus TaxID=182803 RepID=A0A4Y2J2Q7_ARAVE|nr:hypothetical protein AVEN_174903-1 [Araneus ventricosus]
MQTEEYEEWMSIDVDIPVAAALTDLEIYQAIKLDDSDGDECIEENPPTIAEMRQDLDILKRGMEEDSIPKKECFFEPSMFLSSESSKVMEREDDKEEVIKRCRKEIHRKSS